MKEVHVRGYWRKIPSGRMVWVQEHLRHQEGNSVGRLYRYGGRTAYELQERNRETVEIMKEKGIVAANIEMGKWGRIDAWLRKWGDLGNGEVSVKVGMDKDSGIGGMRYSWSKGRGYQMGESAYQKLVEQDGGVWRDFIKWTSLEGYGEREEVYTEGAGERGLKALIARKEKEMGGEVLPVIEMDGIGEIVDKRGMVKENGLYYVGNGASKFKEYKFELKKDIEGKDLPRYMSYDFLGAKKDVFVKMKKKIDNGDGTWDVELEMAIQPNQLETPAANARITVGEETLRRYKDINDDSVWGESYMFGKILDAFGGKYDNLGNGEWERMPMTKENVRLLKEWYNGGMSVIPGELKKWIKNTGRMIKDPDGDTIWEYNVHPTGGERLGEEKTFSGDKLGFRMAVTNIFSSNDDVIIEKESEIDGKVTATIYVNPGTNWESENEYKVDMSKETWEKLKEQDQKTIEGLEDWLSTSVGFDNLRGEKVNDYIDKAIETTFDPSQEKLDAYTLSLEDMQAKEKRLEEKAANDYQDSTLYAMREDFSYVVDAVESESYGKDDISITLTRVEGNWSAPTLVFEDDYGKIIFKVTIDQDKKEAHYDLMEISEDMEGKGIGTELKYTVEQGLIDQGITRFTTLADINVGVYAWAVMGYDFADEWEWKDKGEDFLWKLEDKYKKYPTIWKKIENDPFIKKLKAALKNPEKSAIHSWELAAWRAPNGEKFGKQFMLHTANWYGYKEYNGTGWCLGCKYYQLKGWSKEDFGYCGECYHGGGGGGSTKSADTAMSNKVASPMNGSIFAPGIRNAEWKDASIFEDMLADVESEMLAYISQISQKENATKSIYVHGHWRSNKKTGKRYWVHDYERSQIVQRRKREIKTKYVKTNRVENGRWVEVNFEISDEDKKRIQKGYTGLVTVSGYYEYNNLHAYLGHREGEGIRMPADVWIKLTEGDKSMQQTLADWLYHGIVTYEQSNEFTPRSIIEDAKKWKEYKKSLEKVKPGESGFEFYDIFLKERIKGDDALSRRTVAKMQEAFKILGVDSKEVADAITEIESKEYGDNAMKLRLKSILAYPTEDGKARIDLTFYDKIFNEAEFRFNIRGNAEKKNVNWDSMYIDNKQEGHGIGSEFMCVAENEMQKLGVKEFTLLADGSVGKYAWAVMGYDFDDEFRWFDKAKDMADTATILNRSGDLSLIKEPSNPALWEDAKRTFTITDESQVEPHKWHSWDIASFHAKLSDGKQYGIGPTSLLQTGGWFGVKRIGDLSGQIGCEYYRKKGLLEKYPDNYCNKQG